MMKEAFIGMGLIDERIICYVEAVSMTKM